MLYFNDINQSFNKFETEETFDPKKLKLNKITTQNRIFEMVNFLLLKRIPIENNILKLYVWFVIGLSFNVQGFFETLIKGCFEVFKIFFDKRKFNISINEVIICEFIGKFLKDVIQFTHRCYLTQYFSIQNLFCKNIESGCIYHKIRLLSYLNFENWERIEEKLERSQEFEFIIENISKILNLFFLSRDLSCFIEKKIIKYSVHIFKHRKFSFISKFHLIYEKFKSKFSLDTNFFYEKPLSLRLFKKKSDIKIKNIVLKQANNIGQTINYPNPIFFENLTNWINLGLLIENISFFFEIYIKKKKTSLKKNFENYLNAFLFPRFFFSFLFFKARVVFKHWITTKIKKILLKKKNLIYFLMIQNRMLKDRMLRLIFSHLNYLNLRGTYFSSIQKNQFQVNKLSYQSFNVPKLSINVSKYRRNKKINNSLSIFRPIL